MRKAVLALLLLFASTAAAQDRPNRLSFFASELTLGWAEGSGTTADAGFGIAYERRLGQRWTAELALSREEYTDSGIFPGLVAFDVETYPVDLTVRYHFGDDFLRWRPYFGGGVRYVNGPDTPRGPLADRTSAQLIGGLDFNITPVFSLRADAKGLLRNSEPYDEALKVSIGAGFRF